MSVPRADMSCAVRRTAARPGLLWGRGVQARAARQASSQREHVADPPSTGRPVSWPGGLKVVGTLTEQRIAGYESLPALGGRYIKDLDAQMLVLDPGSVMVRIPVLIMVRVPVLIYRACPPF